MSLTRPHMRSSTTLFLQCRVGIMGLTFGKRKQVGSLWWCLAMVKETVGGRNDGDDDLRPHNRILVVRRLVVYGLIAKGAVLDTHMIEISEIIYSIFDLEPNLYTNSSAESMLRSRAMIISGGLLSKENTLTLIKMVFFMVAVM
ncbi:hypothetical protein M8C21_008478, partial [Ambrosia artemisiifolia]